MNVFEGIFHLPLAKEPRAFILIFDEDFAKNDKYPFKFTIPVTIEFGYSRFDHEDQHDPFSSIRVNCLLLPADLSLQSNKKKTFLGHK